MRTPADKTIAFTLVSHRTARAAMRWMARITFPPGSGGGDILPVEVVDGEDCPVADGVLEFAGQHLRVRGGEAGLRYADFVAGAHSVPIWLHRDGMPPIPGGLTFL